MKNNYVVYHLHSDDSLLDSCTDYKLYIDKASELNQKAICFTEHGNIYNWIEKRMYAESKGIKYMHGCEVYLTEKLVWDNDKKVRYNYHTILIAKNDDGIKELNTLIDLSTRKDHFYYKPRISFDEFFNISNNIIKISACLASPLNVYPRADNANKDVYDKLLRAYDFFEIQPHNDTEQIKYNFMLMNASKKYNTPLIAGTDTHAIDKYYFECRSILKKAKDMEYANEDNFDLSYKSYDELVEMFKVQNAIPEKYYMKAIEETNNLADMITYSDLDCSVKYPKTYDNEEDILRKRIAKMFQDKLNRGVISKEEEQQFKENIKEEFRVFKKINMVGFMLFMSELIEWCWDNNIPVGFCRGSVGGSSIAYITDIIDVNPVRWDTVFSRFANEDRQEVGDIDIDVDGEQRDLIYQHIIDKFSEDNTAFILAIGTVAEKGTIDEIGRALSKKWVEDKCKELDIAYNKNMFEKYKNHNDNPYRLDKIAYIKDEFTNEPEKAKADYPAIFKYFDGILNTKISQSVHPAGIVVSPITLADNYGTFYSDDKKILQINMEEVHEVGLVKYDILGLKNIGIIRKTCEYAGIKYPKSHEIDWNDKNVWNHITDSNVGVFQFESPYAFDLLKRYNPTEINSLSMVNASLRPSGESYRDRLIAGEINKNPSEIIDKMLESNHGFLIFQEDTIKFLKDICGLSGSEADNIRRAIGRKQVDRLNKAMPSILEGYCSKSDKPREEAEKEAQTFLQIISDSSNYQFGFNHSTGYSMIGYVCAYLRYYYPKEFVSAYINCATSQDDISRGNELIKSLGIKVNDIKFRKSKAEYIPDSEENAIYKGIGSIKFLNNTIAEDLYVLKDNNYKSFVELLIDIKANTSVSSKQLDILIKLDFFSEFGERNFLLEQVRIYNSLPNTQFKKEKLESIGLNEDIVRKFAAKETDKQFTGVDKVSLINNMDISVKPRSVLNILNDEKEFLSTCIYKNNKLPESLFYVYSFNTYKDKTKPYLMLYNIKNGYMLKTKITKSTMFIEKPFEENDFINIKRFRTVNKTKKINGEWVVTDEKEKIIDDYSLLN